MDIQATSTTTPPPAQSHLWAGKSFSFHDVLDAINPLQHLPIIATIYRHLTGDTIGNAARVAGDTIYGGPIGLALSLLDAHEVNKTGKDVGEHVVAMLEGKKTTSAPTPSGSATMLAATSPARTRTPDAAPSSPNESEGSAAPHLAGLPVDAQGSIPMAAALAALKSKPAIDLSAFPGAATAATASQTAAAGDPIPLTPTTKPPVAMPVSALPSGARSFAIDTSIAGIAAMHGRTKSGAGVPFQLPAGVMLTNQPQPLVAAPSGADFALKMKQGLAKYQALLAQQAAQHGPPAAQPAS